MTQNYPQGYSLPVNFENFYFEDLRDFFGTIYSTTECLRVLLAYEGKNWVVPHVCGKRTAYLEMVTEGHDVEWNKICKS